MAEVVVPGGKEEVVWMLGGRYTVRISADQSDNALTLMEMELAPDGGPPPHTHPGQESVYVLEGTIDYHIGDEIISAGPGSVFNVPAGTQEFFVPTSAARLLVAYVPGGIDRFFLEMGDEPQGPGLPPPPDGPPSPEFLQLLVETAARHGMEIVVDGI